MYARRVTRPKPLKSQGLKYDAPTAGWVSNRALSSPASMEGPGAAVLDNFFPKPTGVVLRRGKELYATLEDQGLPVTALFTYKSGQEQKLFGANENTIYDLSDVPFARPQVLGDEQGQAFVTDDDQLIGWASTANLDVRTGYTGGDWSVTQFATTGGIYLIGVNGRDPGFIYDGTDFWDNVPGGLWLLPLQNVVTEFEVDEIVTGSTSGASGVVYRMDADSVVLRDVTELTQRWKLTYESGTSAFGVGETIVGDTSGAVAVVQSIDGDPTTGTLTLTGLIGEFEDGETINGQSGGEAIADGASEYLDGGPFQQGETLQGGEGGDAEAEGPQENAAPGVDFGGLDSSEMSFVWSYQNSLWFTQSDSLSAWYLPPDQVGGSASEFPLGGVLANGGSLLSGHRWSLESGGGGGLSDQNIFLTTQGEVAIYQGINPDEAATWSLVGVYRIGTPLGKRAYIRAGGDIAFCTTVGLVPLSRAIEIDAVALSSAAISYKIADAWSDAIAQRGADGWQALVWPENQMAIVSPPDMLTSSDPVMFVTNAETGAWARFTNWQANCLEVFKGELYFGSADGQVFRANATGEDDGEPYTGVVIPLFQDAGESAALKVGKVGRARVMASSTIKDRVDLLSDYSETVPTPPDASPIEGGSTWGSAIWGQSQWMGTTPTVINQRWRSVGGLGYSLAPCYQLTSGSLTPLDAELIDLEITFTFAGLVS